MKFYRIVIHNNIIGVVCSTDFRIWHPRNSFLSIADETNGQFVEYNDTLYRDRWMARNNDGYSYFTFAAIEEITEEEYNLLHTAIEEEEQIPIEDDTPIIEETPIEPSLTLEALRAIKIETMQKTCRLTIEQGIDVTINNQTHHFSLTTQDQLSLLYARWELQNGALSLEYHADNESYSIFTAEEMRIILNQTNNWITYNTHYFNALKAYINTIDSEETLAAITYGSEVPNEFKSDTLIELEKIFVQPANFQ